MYLFGLIILVIFFIYYTNKNKNELSWSVSSTENNSNCKRVCNGDKCDIKCD